MRIDRGTFRFIVFALAAIVFLFTSGFSHGLLAAEERPAGIFGDKDTAYDIYYEVNAYETNRVDGVRIIDTVIFNGVVFLVVRYSDVVGREGYIALDSVRAILPSGVAKPSRSYDGRKQY